MESSEVCAGFVGCSSYIFGLNRNINSEWQFLSCASIAFSERYNTQGKIGLCYQYVHVAVPTVFKPLDDVCLYEAWYEYYTTTCPHFAVGFRTVLCTLVEAVPLLTAT